MAEDENSIARHGVRHSHIGIKLRYRDGEVWERLEALGWNEVGFNFYHPHAVRETLLDFKRGLICFAGEVVWSEINTSDEVLLAALVNELIYKRAKEVASNPALHKRLLKLIRSPGIVAQKRSVLASMGLDIPDEKMATLIARRKQEHPLYHYGVKVDSQAWRDMIQSALSVSSVVLSMEKWSDSLAGKQ